MNYTMYRGDTLILSITVTQTLEGETTPVDLTGASLWMTAKRKPTDKDNQAVFQMTTPTDIVIDGDPTSGRAMITVPPEATASITYASDEAAVTLVYDIQVKTQTGIVQTVAVGKLLVNRDITLAS